MRDSPQGYSHTQSQIDSRLWILGMYVRQFQRGLSTLISFQYLLKDALI